jgi:hypothetical protein
VVKKTVFIYKFSAELKLNFFFRNFIPEMCKIYEHRYSKADTICYKVEKFVVLDLAIVTIERSFGIASQSDDLSC